MGTPNWRRAEELRRAAGPLLVAGTPVRDLLLCAKHLFVAATIGCGGEIRPATGFSPLPFLKISCTCNTHVTYTLSRDHMPRRKLFEARINLPLAADLLARIDAALEADEYRVDFVRNALKRELERREKKSGRKHA
jgi:hypothetical protein